MNSVPCLWWIMTPDASLGKSFRIISRMPFPVAIYWIQNNCWNQGAGDWLTTLYEFWLDAFRRRHHQSSLEQHHLHLSQNLFPSSACNQPQNTSPTLSRRNTHDNIKCGVVCGSIDQSVGCQSVGWQVTVQKLHICKLTDWLSFTSNSTQNRSFWRHSPV